MRWDGEDRGRSPSLSRSLSRSRSCGVLLSRMDGDLLLYWLACCCSRSRALASLGGFTVGLDLEGFSPSSPAATLPPYAEKE